MSALKDLLENFDAADPAPKAAEESGIGTEELEAEKLEAFENGYRAGWDDAVKAQSEEGARISSALAQNLQDLSFTYNEAYSNVMNAMSPLLEEMIGALLPEIAKAALGPHVVELLETSAREAGSTGVIISVAPEMVDSVAPLLESDFGFPVRLDADETLTDGQADLRFDEIERQIDLSEALETIAAAVRGFVHDNQRISANG